MGERESQLLTVRKEYPIILQQYLSDRRNKEIHKKLFVRSETNGSKIWSSISKF